MESVLPTQSFSQPVVSDSDSLLIALFFAAVIHVFIVLGINFTIPEAEKFNKPIEITLASSPAKKAPKKSRFLAQENQLGAGKKTKKPEPPKQKVPSQGDGNKKKSVQRKSQTESKAKSKEKLVTQKKSEKKISSSEKPATPSVKPRQKFSKQSLKKQIAQLGAEIRYSKKSSEKSKIKFVNSVSTHKSVAAQYKKDWEEKIERIGNLNYPEVARKKGFASSLTMDVGINADGTIYGISIIKSSGNKALDDAAKRIVMLSAPFPALPKELLEELEILRIRRVWNFSDKSGMTTR